MQVRSDRVRTLHINGKNQTVDTDGNRMLLWILRDDLDLTGTKYGCGEGQCGACTVLVDGRIARSCRTPVRSVTGKKILTIEGLERNGKLHPVQEAFLQEAAFQCGYCTPGMIMAATALLKTNSSPSEADVKRFLNGNICRCGTYPRIVAAVLAASATLKEGPTNV